MILPSAFVITGPQHAADPVLAVDRVVDFRNPIVGDILVGESRGVVVIIRGCVRVERPPVQVYDPAVAGVPEQPSKFRLGELRHLVVSFVLEHKV